MKNGIKYRIWENGQFIFSGVPGAYCIIKTEKIFGRLDCRSGKRLAKQKNRIFVRTWQDAIAFGARPCKVCKPREDDGYLQCLGCGDFLRWETERKVHACRCGKLEIDGDARIVQVWKADANYRKVGSHPPIRSKYREQKR